MEFQTQIWHRGNLTGIAVPEEVLDELGGGKRPTVQVTVGALTYTNVVGKMAGQFLIPLSADNRKKAGVAGGDSVAVTIALDDAPREVEVPAELATLLEGDAQLAARFEALSFSNRKRLAASVSTAKTEATRKSRLEKVETELREIAA